MPAFLFLRHGLQSQYHLRPGRDPSRDCFPNDKLVRTITLRLGRRLCWGAIKTARPCHCRGGKAKSFHLPIYPAYPATKNLRILPFTSHQTSGSANRLVWLSDGAGMLVLPIGKRKCRRSLWEVRNQSPACRESPRRWRGSFSLQKTTSRQGLATCTLCCLKP